MAQWPKLGAKIIQLLEKNVGVNCHDLGFGNGFLDITPKVWVTKENVEKLGIIKTKHFCAWETITKKMKSKSTE